MAVEIEHYTDAAGRACMRLKRTGDEPPESGNVTPLRAGQVLAHGMVPINAGRSGTVSSIVHFPQSAPSRPAQITEAERAVCRQLGISEADFIAQRRAEQTGAGGASRWRSGAAGGDE